jgi:hypothetical protein
MSMNYNSRNIPRFHWQMDLLVIRFAADRSLGAGVALYLRGDLENYPLHFTSIENVRRRADATQARHLHAKNHA